MPTDTKKRQMGVHFSRTSDEWETPQPFFDELNREFGFGLDVCATADNRKCARWFGIEADGLTQDWENSICWMNPPYSNLRNWMAKASKSAKAGAIVVCLIPSRTDTRAWHDFIWDETKHAARPGVEVRFIKGRLKFGGCDNSAPFPSAVIIFRPL